eukprot:888979_1
MICWRSSPAAEIKSKVILRPGGAWCDEQGTVLPSVEKLVFHTSSHGDTKRQECAWADASNQSRYCSRCYGILFAIQRFCVEIKYPRVVGEYLVWAMFRNDIYRLDVADEDACEQWRDDESAAREDEKG